MGIKCVLHFSLQRLDTTLCPNMWFKELHASSAAMFIAKCEVTYNFPSAFFSIHGAHIWQECDTRSDSTSKCSELFQMKFPTC